MVRSILIVLLGAMIIAAGLGTVSTTTAGQSTPRDITNGEMRGADGQLFVIIYSELGVRHCSFDARVSLQDGRVAEILADDIQDRVGVGSAVADLPRGLESGRVIPGPVHIDDEGRLNAGYAECVVVGEVAHHADSSPDSWLALYPGWSGHLTYRAWTVGAEPVPFLDAMLIINDVENVWEPQFNFALVAGGEDPFDFEGLDYDEQAAANYARMDTNQQVAFFCGGATTACFIVTASSGGKFLRANIVYGPTVWGDPNDWFQHGLAHEFGHGFSLDHHEASCGWVMSSDNCPDLADADDIATALEDVLGY